MHIACANLWIGLLLLCAVGCGAGTPRTQMPSWVNRESGVADEGYQTFAFGVGIDEHVSLSEDEARAAASSRAREALARYLEVRVSSFLDRVSERATAAATASAGGAPPAEARGAVATDAMTRTAREITEQTLAGAEVDLAFDRERGVVYARARISTARLLDASAAAVEPDEQAWIASHHDEAQEILQIELSAATSSAGT